MFEIFNRSLRSRIAGIIALLVAASILALGVFAYLAFTSALRAAALQQVESLAESREQHLVTILRMRWWQMGQVATKTNVREKLAALDDSLDEVVDAELVNTAENGHFASLSAILSTGVVCASSEAARVGTSVADQAWFHRALALPTVGDIQSDPKHGAVIRLTVPARDIRTGQIVGIIMGEASAADIYGMLLDQSGLGETGETYLIDGDGLMLSPSRFMPNLELAQRISGGAFDAASQSRETGGVWADYRQKPVVGRVALKELRAMGVDWSIVAETDVDEALAAAEALQWKVTLFILVCVAVGVGLGLLVSGSLVRPIAMLASAAKRVGDGDLTVTLPDEGRKDEVGILSAAFSMMTDNLRKMAVNMQEGVRTIASSAADIAASAQQTAAAASEQATTAMEVSSTAEEVSQTSQSAAKQALQVVQAAQRALETGRRGADAVDGTVAVMDSIRTRVQDVAQKNRRLSEQSAQIAGIIEAVQDLAEQSNLLALNASIEAAKAGEQGRGFAVVASEVRRLAEQSKHATLEVRRILNEIQKATEDAATATEDGSRRVEEGTQSIQSVRGIIEELTATLEESADRARQIAGTANQQASGVAQIAQAMGGLSQAGRDSAAMVRQLEKAAGILRSLGVDLKKTTDQYSTARGGQRQGSTA